MAMITSRRPAAYRRESSVKRKPPKIKTVAGVLASLPEPQSEVEVMESKLADAIASTLELDDPLPDDLIKDPPRVTLLKDHALEFPSLYFSIYVAGTSLEEAQFAALFSRAGCYRADEPDKADLIVFTGGVDVNPALYGEEPHVSTAFFKARDDADIALYLTALDKGIPMLGVCRGAQFLHVMNGGRLYQDVDGHYGDHSIWDIREKVYIDKTSSVHHQMCRFKPEKTNPMTLVATADKSMKRCVGPTEEHNGKNVDIEAFFYRETGCLGVQGHPEYSGYNRYAKWVLDQIEHYIAFNPDMKCQNNMIRFRPEVLETRDPSVGKTQYLLDYLKKRKN